MTFPTNDPSRETNRETNRVTPIVEAARDEHDQIRFALAMNGGVSLAVWIGGVCDEILRLCVAGWDEHDPDKLNVDQLPGGGPQWSAYQLVCWASGLRPRVDVLAGASAGGMNGVFLALALIYRKQDLRELRDLWRDAGSFAELLRDPLAKSSPSLMKGDEYFLVKLEEAINNLATGNPYTPGQMPIDLTLTATSMEGVTKHYANNYGRSVDEREYAMTLRFRHRMEMDSDFEGHSLPGETEAEAAGRMVKRLARACRSTASYPGAFEPSRANVEGKTPSIDASPDSFLARQASFSGEDYLIDGGTLVNLPVDDAIQAVFEQPATGAVRRVFAMVVPDPSVASATAAAAPKSGPPSLQKVIGDALSTLPRNQTVGRFLQDLNDRNAGLAVVRAGRLGLLTTPWFELKASATALFPAYQASRGSSSQVVLLRHLDDALAQHAPTLTPAVAAERRTQVGNMTAPWIPSRFDPEPTHELNSWGRTTVRRSAARLLHLISVAATTADAPTVQGWRGVVSDAITAMGALTLRAGDTNLFLDVNLDIPESASAPAEIEARLRQLRVDWIAQRENVGEQLGRLAVVAEQLARWLTELPGLHGIHRHEGVTFLLALEVIETTFKGFSPEIEQRVETVRIDSLSISPLDNLSRARAQGKLAGVQLGHFGSFLKASWRANDWMWGRLDGSSDLIDVMLQNRVPDRMRQLRDLFGVADDDAVVRRLKELQQAEIVFEETENIVQGIQSDRDAGGATSRGAKALERAWPPAPAPDRVATARNLLGLNRIGAETIAEQSGSDLLTRISITALATGATVVRDAGPKLLKTPVAAVRFVALLAWGMSKGTFGGPIGRTLTGMTFGIGATLVAIRVGLGISLGPVTTLGIALFIAGALLAFARTPYILVPLLLFMAVPLVLTQLPAPTPTWWPDHVPYLSLAHHTYVPVITFLVGAIVIAMMRRPSWNSK